MGVEVAGIELLGPALVSEPRKHSLFEVVCVAPKQLQTPAGGDRWAAEGKLPQGFFERLREATGCDAVIFVSLTVFQPYPALRTGWKARLVDCSRQETLWAVDEVFDGGANSVAAAAETYGRTDLHLPHPLLADSGVLYSPLRFGQYTASAVAATLPGR